MSIFSRMFPGKAQEPERSSPPSQLDALAETRVIEDGSRNATRRELIRVVVRDTLRKHGIPAHWVQCEVLVVVGRSERTRMHVRLILKHWDERLLRYAYAFERSMVAEIGRFEPLYAQWLSSVSWQIPADSACPYPEMPDPSTWQKPDEPSEDPEVELREDLERLFAIRDLEKVRHAAMASSDPVSDFQNTEPSPLAQKPGA